MYDKSDWKASLVWGVIGSVCMFILFYLMAWSAA